MHFDTQTSRKKLKNHPLNNDAINSKNDKNRFRSFEIGPSPENIVFRFSKSLFVTAPINGTNKK